MATFDFKTETPATLTTAGFLFGATSQAAATPSIFTTTFTGTGALVCATSPALVTPTLGVATATTINKVTLTAPATGSTLTIADGKTATFSNSITFNGTDSTTMTFPASSTTLAGLSIANTFTAQNTFAQGTLTASSPFTMTQTWNNAGVAFTGALLNMTSTNAASGSVILRMQNSSTDSFLFYGREENAFVVVSTNTNGVGAYPAGVVLSANAFLSWQSAAIGSFSFGGFGGTRDLFLVRNAAASLQLGLADAAAPVAQTLRVQSVVAGTSNTAGTNWTLAGSVGTGTGAGGQIILRTAPAGSTGSTQNALATALTLTAPAVNMQPSVVVGNQALATDATDGFLYIPTCAGTPTGTPTAHTGRVALVYDTTNDQFWIYDGAWMQPKTPAGAAIVTWQ